VKKSRAIDADDAIAAVDSNDFGGDTKAHYLPIEPRSPAATMPPSLPVVEDPQDLSAPQLLKLPQLPIAEMFQETLWRAFRAGALQAEPTYEAFALWYEREVLG
jgi:hypothetical protein